MKCEGNSLMQLSLSILSLVARVVSLAAAVPYGDYSVAHMPQYGMQHEDGDQLSGSDEYSDKSPDAPARLDYKFEEESHGKPDDLLEKGDDRIWDKPLKKKRKPLVSHNFDLDKDSFEEVIPEYRTINRFTKRRSRFRNKNVVTEAEKLVKYSSIDQSEDIDNIQNKNDYIHRIKDRVGSDNFEEFKGLSYRWSTQKKARRKARDRSLMSQPERRKDKKYLNLEEDEIDAGSDRNQYFKTKSAQETDTESDRDHYFEGKSAQKPDGIIDRVGMKNPNKHSIEYDEYYYMKRVKNMKNQLPPLIRRNTVPTAEAQSTLSIEQWPTRRAGNLLENSVNNYDVTVTLVRTSTTQESTSTTLESSTISLGTNLSFLANTSELSLAEKSRLSILKKESIRNISSTMKPPVLIQIARKIRAKEDPQPEEALRAHEVSEDSPERLKRALRHMRHKLVAGARSIHDLTDNWDEMVCDYINVDLLDADAASNIKLNNFITVFFVFMSLVFLYC